MRADLIRVTVQPSTTPIASEVPPLRLLANASHEIRGPLHAILGLTEVLASREIRQEDKRLVQALQTEASTLRVLIDDLLDYSRVSEAGLELEKQPFALVELVANVVESSRPLAESKQVSLTFECDPEVPQHLVGDHTRYGQVVRNLVRNAVKFTSVGSVTVSLKVLEGTIACVVQDTGPGIEADMIGPIFNPFVQAHSTAGGTGLGLPISSELARLMGGYIGVESEPGRGSEFTFVANLQTANRSTDFKADPASSGTGGKILVVEDNQVNQLLARTQLEMLGYETVIVGTGEEAVEIAKQGFSAILMDWNLPGIDGLEATRRIRQDSTIEPQPPIIAVTANALISDEEECMAAGMTSFLRKPVSLEQMAAGISRVLEGIEPEAKPLPADPALVIDELVLTLGDTSIVLQLVDTFLNELSKHLKTVLETQLPKDSESLKRIAHTLSSSAALLGATELASICKALDQQVAKPSEEQRHELGREIEATRSTYHAVTTNLRSKE